MLLATNVRAAQGDVSLDILTLLENKEVSSAYQLALDNLAEFEGDPKFDYAFGAAAKAKGELNIAVFAFERVLQVQPNAVDARLALAVSYYDLGNLDASEKELEVLKRFKINNANLSSTVNAYLSAIKVKRQQLENHWQSSLRTGVGVDSNPNNGIDDEFVTIPALGQIALFAESLENDSTYADFQGQFAYVKPVNQRSSWQVSGSISHTEFEDTLALDRTFLATNFAYRTQIKGFDISGSVFYRPLWLDGESILDYYGVTLTTSKQIDHGLTIGIDISGSQENYEELFGFDRDQWLTNTWVSLIKSGSSHRLNLRYGEEKADNNNDFLDRDILGIGYQWKQQFGRRWGYQLSLDYIDSEFQGINPLFVAVREDSFFSSDVEVRYALAERWRLMGRLSYINNDSDIAIYEYKRVNIWVGARYEF